MMAIKYLNQDIDNFRPWGILFRAGLALEVADALPYAVPHNGRLEAAKDSDETGLICHRPGEPVLRIVVGAEYLWDVNPRDRCVICGEELGTDSHPLLSPLGVAEGHVHNYCAANYAEVSAKIQAGQLPAGDPVAMAREIALAPPA